MASFNWDNLMWPEMCTDTLDSKSTPPVLKDAHIEFQKTFLEKIASTIKHVDKEGIKPKKTEKWCTIMN